VRRAVNGLHLQDCFDVSQDYDMARVAWDDVPRGVVYIMIDPDIETLGRIIWTKHRANIRVLPEAAEDHFVIAHEIVHFASNMNNTRHAESGLFRGKVERSWDLSDEVREAMYEKCNILYQNNGFPLNENKHQDKIDLSTHRQEATNETDRSEPEIPQTGHDHVPLSR